METQQLIQGANNQVSSTDFRKYSRNRDVPEEEVKLRMPSSGKAN